MDLKKPHPQLLQVFCIISCLFAATNSGCTRHEPVSAHEQILRISQRNEPADLDPARATLPDEFFIIRALSEGLVTPSPGGGQQPATAERWDISPDGLTYTFHLRGDAHWSNDERVTATDFVESYHRLLTPATAGPQAALFFGVKNARAYATGEITDFNAVGVHPVDDRTLVVTLEQPMRDFLAYAASGPWIPVNPRAVAQHGRTWTQPGHFVGNGPFLLVEWRQQQRIVVKKNPSYRDAARVRLDEIQFLRFDDENSEERAYRAGQIEVTMDVPKTKIETYARERPAELHHAPLAETRFLSFNTRHPPLGDPRVRRALALALDRREIVDRVTLGGQEPAFRFMPPALHPAGEGLPPPLRFDPAEARRLLADAGFPGGKGFPRLELSAWSPSQSAVLEAVQAMWRQELGLDTAIAIREAKVHLATLAAGDYDIAFATTLPLLDVADPLALLENFTSRGPNNYPHWSDAHFDEFLAAAAREPARLIDAEALLIEMCPVAPLYFNTHNWLMSQRVRGWQEDGLSTRFYAGISLQEN